MSTLTASAASRPAEQNLRFILGLKLHQLRKQQGLQLKEVAGRADLAVSYLNEIEKGKKYPKPEKILALARALGTTYDELVSLQLGERLHPLSGVLKSGILQEIPLEVFGLTPTGLLEMMAASPDRISALFDTFVRIARRFDVTIEHLLLAAMRSYVEQNKNYFEDLEQAAEKFRRAHGWAPAPAPDHARIREHLVRAHGYAIDESTLANQPDLAGLRAVTLGAGTATPRLLLHPRLGEWQRSFLLARELGYRELGLGAHSTSPIVKVDSFEQLLNNFRASYFAGALLLDRALLVADLGLFFGLPRWDGGALTALKTKYQATPEMLFHRLSQIVPRFFGLEQMYFVRFDHRRGTPDVRIGKELHYQRMHGTHSIGVNEHYCRRWVSLRSLMQLDARQSTGTAGDSFVPGAQRSKFHVTGDEYFSFSLAHPHSLAPDMNSCVTLGFLVNDALQRTVRFWNDPAVPASLVGDTCERCALADCADRVVPPSLRDREQARIRQLAALAALR
ncbi:MAG TPA: helix-turn-helix domain-containing protein [Opitutaceae bacterium]|nr:helix-turn-helix domain-containing protein [Opitutaceae bacterium]